LPTGVSTGAAAKGSKRNEAGLASLRADRSDRSLHRAWRLRSGIAAGRTDATPALFAHPEEHLRGQPADRARAPEREVPTATAGLNTARIALRPSPTTLDYYADGSWIDVVPVMVQNLLLESFDNTGKLDVIGREAVEMRADYALLTFIREFQADYDGND
jgi:ABC-type transport auxiliary lipoprotein component